MRTFEHFPDFGAMCPICNTNEDRECVLIPLKGTEDGNIMEALATHSDCAIDAAAAYIYLARSANEH